MPNPSFSISPTLHRLPVQFEMNGRHIPVNEIAVSNNPIQLREQSGNISASGVNENVLFEVRQPPVNDGRNMEVRINDRVAAAESRAFGKRWPILSRILAVAGGFFMGLGILIASPFLRSHRDSVTGTKNLRVDLPSVVKYERSAMPLLLDGDLIRAQDGIYSRALKEHASVFVGPFVGSYKYLLNKMEGENPAKLGREERLAALRARVTEAFPNFAREQYAGGGNVPMPSVLADQSTQADTVNVSI